MHAEHRVPVVLGHLEEQVVAEHARIIDQYHGRAELRGDLRDRRLDLVRLAHVRAHGERAAASRGDRVDGAGAFALLQVEHGDRHAVSGKAPGGGRADTPRAAGDDGDPLCFV